MDDKVLNDIEIALSSRVKRAASGFATVLSESPEFKTFQQAADRFRQDQAAQQALGVYKQKPFSWRDLTMLNALTDESCTELENLQSSFVNEPVVQEYFKAQIAVATLCQALGERLSESIGLNYVAACGVSYWGQNAVMQTVLSPQLLEATQSLIDHLLADQTLMRFQQACNRVDQDSEVRTLLDRPSNSRSDLRQQQSSSSAAQADPELLRLLQQRLQYNPVFMEYDQSRKEAVGLLRGINGEISQLLGIDFAYFADPAFTIMNTTIVKRILEYTLPSRKKRRTWSQNVRSVRVRRRVHS